MALGSTQPLTEMSTRYISWGYGGKGGRYVRLTTLPQSCAVVMKSGKLNFLEHSGPLQACNGTALRLYGLCMLYNLSQCFSHSLTVEPFCRLKHFREPHPCFTISSQS
jgi:hypothetical protein